MWYECVFCQGTDLVQSLISFSFTGDLSAEESSEKDQERKKQLQDPVLMPLPDAGADGPLDWAHLVDAAKAFEGRCTSFNQWR